MSLNTFKQSIPSAGNDYLSQSEQNTMLLNETIQDSYNDKICVSWKKLTFTVLLTFLFCLLIIITVIGNTLVILSVVTTRRLRTGKSIENDFKLFQIISNYFKLFQTILNYFELFIVQIR